MQLRLVPRAAVEPRRRQPEHVLHRYRRSREAVVFEHRNRDYEGVEVIKDTAYVLKSNGEIFYFHLKKKGIGEVKKIKTDLSKRNDAEGLGFHEDSNELLITCKEDPGTKKVDIENSRAIYRVDLLDNKFKKKPRYIIDGKSYNKMLEEKGLSKKKHKPFLLTPLFV